MTPESLWAALFGSIKPASTTQRPSIVDLVREDYGRLRTNPKLGVGDKARLDDHVARIADIQRRQSISISCAAPAKPAKPPGTGCADWQNHVDFYRSFQDIVVAALNCGLTRVVTQLHQGCMQRQFAGVIVPLAAQLDALKDANGTSLLDRSLVYWTHEHGVFSHGQENIPVVTFGGAGGAFRTGQHLDYRDMTRPLPKGQFGETLADKPYVGLTWHQMLGTIAQAYGVPRAEWGESNHGGFGMKPSSLANSAYGTRSTNWGNAEWDVAGEKLPWWTT